MHRSNSVLAARVRLHHPLDLHRAGYEWFTLRANPHWDPELEHYPSDLAARLGCVAVVKHPPSLNR